MICAVDEERKARDATPQPTNPEEGEQETDHSNFGEVTHRAVRPDLPHPPEQAVGGWTVTYSR